MDVDEKLLSLNKGAEVEAGELQAAKREASLSLDSEEGADLSLREQVQLDRQEELQSEEETPKKSFRTSSVRKGTDSLLKAAWTNLIPSFGLTLLYIDLHFILNKVLGDKFFGPLGEEWIPAGLKNVSTIAGAEKEKGAGGAIKVTETAGCALLNLLVLFIIIGIIALITLIVSFLDSPLKTTLKFVKDWASQAFKGFASLFKK